MKVTIAAVAVPATLALLSAAALLPTTALGAGDERLHGYWLPSRDGGDIDGKAIDADRAETVEAVHPDGRLAGIVLGDGELLRPYAGIRVEADGEEVTFRYPHGDAPRTFAYTVRDDDTIAFSGEEGEFFYRRLPAEERLLAALLRLALTGEVRAIRPADASETFPGSEAFRVDLEDYRTGILVVGAPDAELGADLVGLDVAGVATLGDGVVAFAAGEEASSKRFESVVREAARSMEAVP